MGEMTPDAFEEFALPCLKWIAEEVKSAAPEVPFFIFPKGAHYCNDILSKETKFDVISIDWT